MPLNIRVSDPSTYSGAVLPNAHSEADVFNSVSNLVGYWEPSTLADGEVTSLLPTYGPNTLSGNAAGVNKSMVGGVPAVTFDASNIRLLTSWPMVGGASGTVMVRFYVRNSEADMQNLYGPPGYRLIYRSGSNPSFARGMQWSGTSNVAGMTLAPPVVGWHTAELYFGASAVRLIIDGVEHSAAQSGITNANLFFGNSPGAGSNTSIAVGKMFAANSDIYGTSLQGQIRQIMAR